jgi:excisionase family DNA binding protein
MSHAVVPIPTEEQAKQAIQVVETVRQRPKTTLPSLVWPDGSRIKISKPLLSLLELGAELMVRGQGINLVPCSSWLTTQEAAELLGCSRQHVVDLIESGKLSGIKPGIHRRIKLSTVLDFIEVEDGEREKAFRKLIADTDKMGSYQISRKAKKDR